MIPEPSLVITRAQAGDLAALLALFEDARAWMIERGVNRWRPVAQWSDMIAQKIADQSLYLARLDSQIVGAIALEWAAGELWDDAPAGYLAHFTTSRALAGSGIGAHMLRWAEAEARRAGKRYLRLDCWAENHALCAYYERAGFQRHSTLALDGFAVALYQKQVS